MRLLLPERQTLRLGVAGAGGDGAMLVAIAEFTPTGLMERGNLFARMVHLQIESAEWAI